MQHDVNAYEVELSETEQGIGILEERKNRQQNDFKLMEYMLNSANEKFQHEGHLLIMSFTNLYLSILADHRKTVNLK